MRRGLNTLVVGSLVAVVAATGCKNQSTGFTNPFLTADKVPPPQTRVLAPGTAQPYYPGDLMPGAAPTVGTPTIGAPVAAQGFATPPTTAPLQQGYAPAPTTGYPTYPTTTTPAMTTPPGGWGGGTYPPQSSFDAAGGVNGDAVSVPGDQQGLRFAAAESAPVADQVYQASAVEQAVQQPSPTFSTPSLAAARLPIQSMFPSAGAAVEAPGSGTSRLAQREVTPAEYFTPQNGAAGAQLASARMTRDGFRPQGSAPRTAEVAVDDAFRPPSQRGAAPTSGMSTGSVAASVDELNRFAAGENYESLRGQLEYWPTSGEWSLRYTPEGAPADAFGGRVMIDNPQVLANLQPGEMVTVRGQAFSKTTESGVAQPAYRVAAVQRQRL